MNATEFAPCRHLTQPWQFCVKCRQAANSVARVEMSQKGRNTTRLKCWACHATWRWTRPKCCAWHENCHTFSENRIAPATQNGFRHVAKHVWMSRSAMPATRNEATDMRNLQKRTLLRNLYHRHGHRGPHRVARERLQTVADGWATSSEHTLNPQTPRGAGAPEWNGNPCYTFGKNWTTSKREWWKPILAAQFL